MPDFQGGPNYRTPFGRNNFLRSTRGLKTESYTVAKASVPSETIDGSTGQKVLQPGTVMAKITSGGDAGKIGPFDRGAGGGVAAINEVQGITPATSGNTTVGFQGVSAGALTLPTPADTAGAAILKTALENLPDVNPGDVNVTVGSGGTAGMLLVEFTGSLAGINLPIMTATGTGAAITTVTQGAAATTGSGAATDGRQDPANIVGICNTFLPWQLMERDVEIAVLYECTAVQAWCFEYDNGVRSTLSNSTADRMRGTKGLDILFK